MLKLTDPPSAESPMRTGPGMPRRVVLVWVLGLAQIGLSTCCITLATTLVALPPGQIERSLEQSDATPAQIQEFNLGLERLRETWAGVVAILTSLLLIPGLGLVVLGFFLLRGEPAALTISRWITTIQLFVLGGFTLVMLAGAILSGQPAQVTMVLLVWGSFMALLWAAWRSLRAPLPAAGAPAGRDAKLFGGRQDLDDESTDPWAPERSESKDE